MTITQQPKYEVLEHLPPDGPMYIPIAENGEKFYQEGFVVKLREGVIKSLNLILSLKKILVVILEIDYL